VRELQTTVLNGHYYDAVKASHGHYNETAQTGEKREDRCAERERENTIA